jgi:hydroxymethylbilane synthase
LFSKEIESCVLDKTADIGVHSLKDLETPRPHGLHIVAYLPRADARDVLVTHFDEETRTIHGCGIDALPIGCTVGTSAPRRMAQLHHHRPDLNIISLRGNVGTRLGKLHQGYDAMVFAKAGLDRLNLAIDPEAILPLDVMIPAVGQGIIALECRIDDTETTELLRPMNDPQSERSALLERGYIEGVEGASCRSAIAIHSTIAEDHMHVRMMLKMPDYCTYNHTFPLDMSVEKMIHNLLSSHSGSLWGSP